MEVLTLEGARTVFNFAMLFYMCHILLILARKKTKLKPKTLHHIYTHASMGMTLVTAVNVFFEYGWIWPLMFIVAYAMQHIMKEDLRMSNGKNWNLDLRPEDG